MRLLKRGETGSYLLVIYVFYINLRFMVHKFGEKNSESTDELVYLDLWIQFNQAFNWW